MLYEDQKTKETLHVCDNCMSELGYDYVKINIPHNPHRIEACSVHCLTSQVLKHLRDIEFTYRNASENRKALHKWADMLGIEKDLYIKEDRKETDK